MIWIDNVLSFGLVMVCWSLAHQFAAAGAPRHRVTAAVLSILAILITANAFFRNVPDLRWLLPYSLLASKAMILVTLSVMLRMKPV